MSQSLKSNLTVVSLILAITISGLTFIQSLAVSPYRLEQSERAIKALQEEARTSRELLVRIEERIKSLQKAHNVKGINE